MSVEHDLSPPTEEHVRSVCQPGKGAGTCRYLCMSPRGWSCEKLTSLGAQLDAMCAAGRMSAQADNCPGKGDQ